MKDYSSLLSLEKEDPPEIVADKFYIYLTNNSDKYIFTLDTSDEDNDKNVLDIDIEKLNNEISNFVEFLKNKLHWDKEELDRFYESIIKITDDSE